jgi:ABC-type multidrug transport system fused ATPase/permease subunit
MRSIGSLDAPPRGRRRAIGGVLQDPLLCNDTIRNNIAYGKPDPVRRPSVYINRHHLPARLAPL